MDPSGTSSKGSQNIAEWLPLLGSIVQALRGMADDGPTEERTPAAASDGEINPGETAR